MGNIFTNEMFRDRLTELMDEKKINKSKLAEAIEIDRKTIGNWTKESNPLPPSIENLFKLSEQLNVSIDYLVGRTPYRNIGNKEIVELTGLSEKALELLHSDLECGVKQGFSKGPISNLISHFLDNYEEFPSLLLSIYDYLVKRIEADNLAVKDKNNLYYVFESGKRNDAADVALLSCQRKIVELINDAKRCSDMQKVTSIDRYGKIDTTDELPFQQ